MRGINYRAVYLFATIASILLSCSAAFRTSVINPDGFCYVQSAATMPMGLSTAMHLCGQAQWPFYSILIFGVMKITHVAQIPAAFLLNGMLTLISVLIFIAITQVLTSSKRIVWLAAGVILLAHEFNAARTDVIRDHGFWAFYLVSLFCLLKYFHMPRWRYAITWSIALIVATLFRIEGAIFLLAIPFAAWFDCRVKWGARVKSFLQLNSLTILALVALLLYAAGHSQQSFGRLNEVQFQLVHGVTAITQIFQDKAAALGQSVLSIYSARDANLVLFLMLISWYVVSAAINLSLVYAALVIYAWWKKLLPNDFSARLALWSYVIVNVIITSIFLVENFFLTKRYLMALSLTLMFWVPFALNDLIQQWHIKKWPLMLALFFVAFYAAGGIIDFGYSKKYLREAGDWLATNTAQTASIYTNDFGVMYYSNHFDNTIFSKFIGFRDVSVIAHGKWRQYDYLALCFDKRDPTAKIMAEIPMKPVQDFKNKRGDEVVIYKVH